MTDKKPCVLEGAPAEDARATDGEASGHSRPCALLCPDGAATPVQPPAPEDESADPVGDGHSDAEFAAEHPRKD
ncbi:hypothetical protein [Hydrogenophaga sp. 2FB]|uniref:hypothetical protein n=1 Tax=Hydrogenophaga sp. 2FB TaxID=2502187 RepID=UPI0010F6F116|nr:hypothetical protein [Hydrogenophaga sp. 2FB]